MKLYRIEDLKSSRIFFDKNPPAFLTIFIMSVLIMLMGFIWVCTILPKNYIVEAQGVVTTVDNGYIGAYSDGIVVDIKKKENDWVDEGEVLLVISNGSEGVQIDALNKQLNQAQSKIEAMDLFEKSLNDKVNYLQNKGLQQEYYGKMEYYLSLLSDEKATTENQKKEKIKKQEKLVTKKQELTNLEKELNKLNGKIENLDNLDIQSKKEKLKTEIESKKSEIETLENEIEQLNQQSSTLQLEQTRLQFISELGTSRTMVESNMVELQSQINVYKKQDELIEIKASQQGYLHYLSLIKDGVSIQKGQTIAEISENKEAHMIVEAYIQAIDRTKVDIEDEVKVAIQGVNTQKYGTLSGKLVEIDNGTLTQETNNGNAILYKCKIEIDQMELSTKKGEKIQLVKSMPVVARIVYDKETYMDWLLEMLNFKN